MHAMIVAVATVLLTLWPAGIRAQCSNQCEGDFNCDGQVTIDEIIVAVNNSLNDCPVPGPRFIDNGDGTVSDTRTGLMWEKKDSFDAADSIDCPGSPTCVNPHDADNRYTLSIDGSMPDGSAYTDFLAKLNGGSGFAGHTDWRLPTVDELQNLVDHATFDPAINAAFNKACTATCTVATCSCTVRDDYWTTTPVADIPTNSAWIVNFNRGIVEARDDTTIALYVRAVRHST